MCVCVSVTDLPMREILFSAGHDGSSSLLRLVIFVEQLLKSCVHNRVFGPSHSWIMDILLLLG